MHSEHHPAPVFQGFRPAALPPTIGMHTPGSAASHPHHGTCSDLLPPLLQDFERLIGLQPTMALVQRWGGLRIYVPTPDKVTPEHPYAATIGVPALLQLAREYGGLPHFQLPRAARALQALRNQRIAADYATDKTARQLAAEHGITEGQVGRIVAALGVTAPARRRRNLVG
ncbi:hypothetical protein CHL79_14510 [Delftia acidovorans]|uniref:Mor transcription activator family protein n=1 Tax=Delftia acidovorans TaxID=80866 RepID=UPI000BC2C509|nr:Mor transcription activator family protein [Delftia acidovorans]ATH13538.1 hypothetical protein CHL79_14510 [Delftia acidovorans]